jgi:hypothetical protein
VKTEDQEPVKTEDQEPVKTEDPVPLLGEKLSRRQRGLTKTRSKQKNQKRDTRPENVKREKL